MDRLFERFFESPWAELPALGDWTPALHVSEGKDAISVKAELPGVDAKDIAVSLEGDVRAPAPPGRRRAPRARRSPSRPSSPASRAPLLRRASLADGKECAMQMRSRRDDEDADDDRSRGAGGDRGGGDARASHAPPPRRGRRGATDRHRHRPRPAQRDVRLRPRGAPAAPSRAAGCARSPPPSTTSG